MGVWIEIREHYVFNRVPEKSLPAWECGLKFKELAINMYKWESLPAWECGLKCHTQYTLTRPLYVTPCVGVWIEIEH